MGRRAPYLDLDNYPYIRVPAGEHEKLSIELSTETQRDAMFCRRRLYQAYDVECLAE